MPIFFSRDPLENTNQESLQLTSQALLSQLLHSHITSKEISFSLQWKPVLFKVLEYVLTGWPDSKRKQLKPYHYRRNEFINRKFVFIMGK